MLHVLGTSSVRVSANDVAGDVAGPQGHLVVCGNVLQES